MAAVTSNPRLTIRAASDGLSAFLCVAAGSPIAKSDFDIDLRNHGIQTGIIQENYTHIAEALADLDFACDEVMIASGIMPQPGQDARLELGFAEGIQAGHVREDGSVDYHDRDLLKPICCGDVLGVVHPATPGTAGQRVDGTAIPAPPVHELAVEFRSGVELDAELLLRATRDGVILYKAGQLLDVVDHHVHQGPVDIHSGNLRMQGSLAVKGDVKHPFSVVATGDIEIYGNVDSASVRAGGRLHVRGGVHGGEGSAVCAEGDMTLYHAEAVELHCGGQLRVQEAVNGELHAVQIHASGRLRGGSATAESQIAVKEVGAAHGIDTRLIAGEPLLLPVAEAQRVINALKAERMAQRAGGRSNDRGKGGKVGRVRAELDTAEVQRLAERARRREKLLDAAFIQIGVAHPGVSVRIGHAHVTLDTLTKSTRYTFDRESSSLRIEKASG
jgi:uncharacterized protein (DUF342 family)